MLVEGKPLDVFQVWCDPARPDAHRDPALRAYLAAMHARFGMPAFIRYNSRDGFLLVPPAVSGTGDWLELDGNMVPEAEMAAKLAAVGGRGISQ